MTQDELNNISTFEERDNEFKSALKQAPEFSKKLQKDIEQASIKPTKLNPQDLKKVPVDE